LTKKTVKQKPMSMTNLFTQYINNFVDASNLFSVQNISLYEV